MCRHHLSHFGQRVVVRDVGELRPDFSCALDVADSGGVTLQLIADRIGFSRERIRQIEERTLERLATTRGWRDLAPEGWAK